MAAPPSFPHLPAPRVLAWSAAGLAVAGLLVVMPVTAPAQSSAQKDLERLEREQAKREERLETLEADADRTASEIADLRRRLVRAAEARDRLERDVERSQTRLQRLRREERGMTARLLSDRKAMEDLVVALIAVERDRPPALAVTPDNAAEAARAAILMGTVAPELEERSQALSASLAELRETRQSILMENTAFRRATEQLAEARRTVGALIAERQKRERELRREAGIERDAVAGIARRAADLRDLITRLGIELPQLGGQDGPAFARGFLQARGRLLRPVAGELTTEFGERTPEGGRADGISFATRPGSQVLAPFDGRVEFAGPFRSFGQVVILNVGDGNHLVLAGLGTVFAEAGQEVLAGEPVGETGEIPVVAPGQADAEESAAGARLYMEVRLNGEPVDPEDWLVPVRPAD